jgi:hypothetical protein
VKSFDWPAAVAESVKHLTTDEDTKGSNLITLQHQDKMKSNFARIHYLISIPIALRRVLYFQVNLAIGNVPPIT